MSASHLPPFPARDYDFREYVAARNWIAGGWREAATDHHDVVTNPRHGQVIGTVPMSGEVDVDAAVSAAAAAFPAWRDTPMKERVQVLYRVKALIERDLEELSWLVSHENGKTYEEGKASVLKGIECLEMGISIPNMAGGPQLDVSRGIKCEVSYEPIGVCAGVSPFNFPFMVPLWMLPQALVAGNTFVLKPSEKVPYGAMKLAALFHEAGLPAGVLNVVHGGQAAVEGLVDHPKVKAIGFVGSTRVARLVYSRGAAHGKRMLCLGGAKNHLIVAPDADLELTSTTVAASAFGCAGQRCMAAAVMVAVGDTQALVDATAEQARKWVLGKDLGAIISKESVERITRYIDEAERMGAKVLVDGRGATVEGAEGGFWFGPTVLDHVTPEMPAGCEEVFGPVLSIIRAKTIDEAIAIENASPYGNAASIFTQSGGIARYVMERVSAGMCGVNVGVPVPREPFAFGGWNDSKFGHGDITGWDGFRFWTRPRKVTTRWAQQKDMTWMS
ncbi:MAG: CoA-acylating methylmalonate-semialdehyde dehydrogenase [Myxococcales bacterium]|nr:CoA-acylating methylmalonate-semialdehyde dehydrogenase [Myxococcales bacterium]MCB9704305.1 CoA-acylating methylmalonate-semialdehyde dehydrogenase [Myxococcales bacterium]